MISFDRDNDNDNGNDENSGGDDGEREGEGEDSLGMVICDGLLRLERGPDSDAWIQTDSPREILP